MGAQRAGRWTRWLPAGYSLLLTLVITAPLLRSGYLLLRDAVSTPRSYLTDTALGLGDAAPRAVPQDALVATLSVLVDGGVVVVAILVTALWAAGYGAAVLARELLRAPLAAQWVATTLAVWNPYVAERLLQGHWSLLTGYAALPWIALAALRVRRIGAGHRPGAPVTVDGTTTDPQATDRTAPRSRGRRVGAIHFPAFRRSADNGSRTGLDAPAPTAQPSPADTPAGRNTGTNSRADAAPPRSSRSDSEPHPAPDGRDTDRTGIHIRSAGFRNRSVLAGLLAAAGLTPTGALLGAIVAVVIAGRRRAAGVLALAVVASAPWLLATAVSGVAAEPSDPAGVPAFAARAEPWLGTVGSLAGLGGIWNADAVPGSRTTPLAAIATVLLLAVLACGIRRAAASDGDPERTRARRILLVLAATAVALPALAATPAGLTVMEWLVVHVPGAGLLRDTQKFVALAVPGYSLCAAAACASPIRRAPASAGDAGVSGTGPGASTALAALFIGMLVLPLPDLGWGVGGQMQAVRYPDSWGEAAERIDGPGDIAVLPGGMFRRFPYSGSAPVLDPAPRMLPRDVLQTGALPVHGETVAGEGARAQAVEDLLLAGGDAAELGRLGVGWVLVERDTPGPLGESDTTLAQLTPVFDSDELRLYRVDEVTPRPAPGNRGPVIGAHILWGLLLVTPLFATLLPRLSRSAAPRPRPAPSSRPE